MDVMETHSTQSAENVGYSDHSSQKLPSFAFAVVTAGRPFDPASPDMERLSTANRKSSRNGSSRRVGKCQMQKVRAKQSCD